MTIEDLLKEHRIPIAPEGHKHSSSGWIQLDCVYCGQNSQSFHMGISKTSYGVSCWKCGAHRLGDTLALLLPRLDKKILWQQIKKFRVSRASGDEIRKTGVYTPLSGIGPLQAVHKGYLRGRGFDPDELVRLWGLQATGIHATHPWRIFIPVHYQGKAVSWTTRAIGSKITQRYLSAPPAEETYSHKTLLYGEDYTRNSVIVVEGPPDVWAGGPGTVALFGTGFCREQVRKLAKYSRVAIAMDNEREAQCTAGKIADYLSGYPTDVDIVQLDSKDLGSATKKEISHLRKTYLGDR